MKMPGFTAEASLYAPTGHYRVASTGSAGAQILPQSGVIVPVATCCIRDTTGKRRCWNCLTDADPADFIDLLPLQ
jgi:hypothetical protein